MFTLHNSKSQAEFFPFLLQMHIFAAFLTILTQVHTSMHQLSPPSRALLLLLGCIAAVALLYTFNPTDWALAPKCLFKVLTGFSCPGCGFQRAAHAALHGHWAEAWAYNRFLIYSLPYLLCVMLAEWCTRGRLRERLRRIFEGREACWTYVLLFVVWGVVRNVYGI